ncbi:hypothetical protein [Niallia sp. Krafla_26]|uniref:hypothetical protein n=1 Tax=Niallia sp. Krafla_26 TaxID=3064703 RepID=UPI003D18206A
MKRIFIFAGSQNRSKEYRGYFDGNTFHPKLGFCHSLDELYQFDYVEFYGMDGLLCYSPKRFHSDLLRLMNHEFIREYGEMTLFD